MWDWGAKSLLDYIKSIQRQEFNKDVHREIYQKNKETHGTRCDSSEWVTYKIELAIKKCQVTISKNYMYKKIILVDFFTSSEI